MISKQDATHFFPKILIEIIFLGSSCDQLIYRFIISIVHWPFTATFFVPSNFSEKFVDNSTVNLNFKKMFKNLNSTFGKFECGKVLKVHLRFLSGNIRTDSCNDTSFFLRPFLLEFNGICTNKVNKLKRLIDK